MRSKHSVFLAVLAMVIMFGAALFAQSGGGELPRGGVAMLGGDTDDDGVLDAYIVHSEIAGLEVLLFTWGDGVGGLDVMITPLGDFVLLGTMLVPISLNDLPGGLEEATVGADHSCWTFTPLPGMSGFPLVVPVGTITGEGETLSDAVSEYKLKMLWYAAHGWTAGC